MPASRVTRAMKVQEALLNFGGGIPFDTNLDTYLTHYSRVDQGDLPHYSLGVYKDGDPFHIVRDTTYAFELRDYESTIALIGFDVEGEAIYVKQIQGAWNKHEYLRPLKWERMLLRIVVDWASQNGFRQVRVQRAENNVWWEMDSDFEWERRERQERLKMRYDVTARRSGFRFDERLGCHVLDL